MADVIIKAKLIDEGFNANIRREIGSRVKAAVEQIQGDVQNLAVDIFIRSMREQPQYASLAGGELQHELGVTTSVLEGFMSEAEDILRSTCAVRYIRAAGNASNIGGNNDVGGLSITFENLIDALENANDADFLSEGSFDGYRPPAQVYWLRWLLRYQLRVAVQSFEYIPLRSVYSRTGMGYMREAEGVDYYVSDAGTTDNNWITQAANTARRIIIERAGQLIVDRLST